MDKVYDILYCSIQGNGHIAALRFDINSLKFKKFCLIRNLITRFRGMLESNFEVAQLCCKVP